jgi:hypothetical protein
MYANPPGVANGNSLHHHHHQPHPGHHGHGHHHLPPYLHPPHPHHPYGAGHYATYGHAVMNPYFNGGGGSVSPAVPNGSVSGSKRSSLASLVAAELGKDSNHIFLSL